jgi:CheY-like chemotaxis protein
VKFLIVEDNPDSRFLLSKTLLRKFPTAAIVECQSSETAQRLLAQEPVSLVIAHRTYELSGVELVRALREANPLVPVIAVSGVDRKSEVLAAGANRFHLLDEWLLLGNAVEELLSGPRLAVQSQ